MLRISRYWKGVIAGTVPVVLAVQAAVTDSRIEPTEWIPIGIAVLAALGVVRVPNKMDDPDTLPQFRQ